jgi:hypothetical protein
MSAQAIPMPDDRLDRAVAANVFALGRFARAFVVIGRERGWYRT